jgi:Brp/Blh family beta-carotene 15,15'-monooxygenase
MSILRQALKLPSEYLMSLPWVAIVLVQLSGYNIPVSVQYLVFFTSIVLTGIPHGALDHLVDEQNKKLSGQRFTLWKFLLAYLTRMLCFAFIWYLSPAFALLIFLLISAFHFGETDLCEKDHRPVTILLSFIYGTGLLFFLLFAHWDQVDSILQSIPDFAIPFTVLQLAQEPQPLLFILTALQLSMILFLRGTWKEKSLLIIRTLLMLVLLYVLPLLLAFTFYFGSWHSIRSLSMIRTHLNRTADQPRSLLGWWWRSIPLTLLALFMLIALIVVLNAVYGWSATLISLFIGVAILTAPHLSVMSNMYDHLRNRPSTADFLLPPTK